MSEYEYLAYLHNTPNMIGVLDCNQSGQMRHYFATSDGERILFLYANDRGVSYASEGKVEEMFERGMNPAYVSQSSDVREKCASLAENLPKGGAVDGVYYPHKP